MRCLLRGLADSGCRAGCGRPSRCDDGVRQRRAGERTMRADNWQPSDQAWVNANREDARGYERTESQIDYEILRDTLIAAFNPPDEDAAEPAVMTSAIDRAWAL